jgi:hypothetical protein
LKEFKKDVQQWKKTMEKIFSIKRIKRKIPKQDLYLLKDEFVTEGVKNGYFNHLK